MGKVQWKGGTLLAPVPPVLVSSGTVEAPNVCTAAWCGIVNSQPPMTYVSLRKSRFTHELVSQSGEFVLNLPTEALLRAVDYCGVKSGREENKFETCHLSALPCGEVAAPQVGESPVSLECKVTQVLELGSHDMFLAEILAVDVQEELIGEKGRLRMAKAGLVAFAHGEYFALGRRIGSMGCSVRKKPRPGQEPKKKRPGK